METIETGSTTVDGATCRSRGVASSGLALVACQVATRAVWESTMRFSSRPIAYSGRW